VGRGYAVPERLRGEFRGTKKAEKHSMKVISICCVDMRRTLWSETLNGKDNFEVLGMDEKTVSIGL
jgi:hypothetical protein